MVNTNQAIHRIVIDLTFFAVLDRKLQHFDFFRAGFDISVKDYSFKPTELWTLGRQAAQTCESAVAVDNSTICKDNTRLPLIYQFNIGLCFFNGIRIAFHDEFFDNGVIFFSLICIGRLPLMCSLILTNPCRDTVILIVVEQVFQFDPVYRIGFCDAIQSDLSGHCGFFHKMFVQTLFQQIHNYISSKYVS